MAKNYVGLKIQTEIFKELERCKKLTELKEGKNYTYSEYVEKLLAYAQKELQGNVNIRLVR